MWVCGIDETGRGALAGPLCVVAFCSNKMPTFYTNDSKKLTPQKRTEVFYNIINFIKENRKNAFISIKFIDNKKIDEINILRANLLAFEIVIKDIEKKIGKKPDIIYIDGNKIPYLPDYNIIPVIKGDSKIKSIQIASIVAKVIRDRLMNKLSLKFPQYNFNENKGYYDKKHVEAIRKYGYCDFHRKSFLKNILQLNFSYNISRKVGVF